MILAAGMGTPRDPTGFSLGRESSKRAAARIVQRRRAKKMTQSALAERTGIKQGLLSNLETGKKSLQGWQIKKIAIALDTTPEQIADEAAKFSQVDVTAVYSPDTTGAELEPTPDLKIYLQSSDGATLLGWERERLIEFANRIPPNPKLPRTFSWWRDLASLIRSHYHDPQAS